MSSNPRDKIDSSLDLLRGTTDQAVETMVLADLVTLLEEPDDPESRPEGLGSATTIRLPENEE